MAYLKLNDIDFSMYVNELKVSKNANYSAQTNAAGNTVVDYINSKRTIEVGIIPLTSEAMASLQAVINSLEITVTFLNPQTGALDSASCILPSTNIDFYTIQANKVSYKKFSLKFDEL